MVVEANIHVIHRTVRPLHKLYRIPRWTVGCAIGWIEINNVLKIAGGVEGQTPDPVLHVVSEKIISVIFAGKLAAAVNKPAHHAAIAAAMRIGIKRIGCSRNRTSAFAQWPAIVCTASAEVHLFDRSVLVITAYVPDIHVACYGVDRHTERIAQSQSPDFIHVRSVSIKKRVISGNRSVKIDAKDFPLITVQLLCQGRIEVISHRDVELAIQSNRQGSPMMLRTGVVVILPEHYLAGGIRGIADRRKARNPIAVLHELTTFGIEDVEIAILIKIRINQNVHQPLLPKSLAVVEPQKRSGIFSIGPRLYHPDYFSQFSHQHPTIGKKGHRGGRNNPRHNDFVNKRGVLHRHRNRVGRSLVPSAIGGNSGQCVRAIRESGAVPVGQIRGAACAANGVVSVC